MAQFLPVVPPNYMHKIHSECNKGTIGAFLLAHEVVKDPEAYRSVRHLWQNDGSDNEVISILDNSAIELGVAVDLDMVKTAADICSPQVVVLPDALEDADNTIRLTKAAYPIWDRVFSEQSLMFVPQSISHYIIWDLILCLILDIIPPISPFRSVFKCHELFHPERRCRVNRSHARMLCSN